MHHVCDCEGESHFKVAQAALEAVQVCLQQHSQQMEPSLDRLLPLLSLRITDPKEAIRGAAVGYALVAVGYAYAAVGYAYAAVVYGDGTVTPAQLVCNCVHRPTPQVQPHSQREY